MSQSNQNITAAQSPLISGALGGAFLASLFSTALLPLLIGGAIGGAIGASIDSEDKGDRLETD